MDIQPFIGIFIIWHLCYYRAFKWCGKAIPTMLDLSALITLFLFSKHYCKRSRVKSKKRLEFLDLKNSCSSLILLGLVFRLCLFTCLRTFNIKMPDLSLLKWGRLYQFHFLILNVTGAVLPVCHFGTFNQKNGDTKTHTICIGSMAVGYLGNAVYRSVHLWFMLLMAFIAGLVRSDRLVLPFAIMTRKSRQFKNWFIHRLF